MYASAINQLTISAQICENNAPIHEAEGKHEQAALSRANAQSYRAAIQALGQPPQDNDHVAPGCEQFPEA